MSISSVLANLELVDPDGIDEYLQNLADLVPAIERGVARLKREPDNGEQIADLFRTLHNLKGDAAICQVKLGVLIAHPLETLLGRLRSGELQFTPLLGEVLLLGVDRLEMAVEAQAGGRPLGPLRLQALIEGMEALCALQPEHFAPAAAAWIADMTGNPAVNAEAPSASRAEDLHFFQRLALRLEERAPWLQGRFQRQRQLALDTLALADSNIDPQQLEAAIYMHDVGMMFLPEKHWLKEGPLDNNDITHLHLHPTLAAGLLERMPGWQEAAAMVAQHHERIDGTGYPAGLTAANICPGAHLLALVDAFEAIMARQDDRESNRALLCAMSEINASDQQFDPLWVEHFNQMVRQRTQQA